MSSRKLTIEQLKIQSFVTSDTGFDIVTVKGGREYEVSKRVVDGGCWVSEVGGPETHGCPNHHLPRPKTSNGDEEDGGG